MAEVLCSAMGCTPEQEAANAKLAAARAEKAAAADPAPGVNAGASMSGNDRVDHPEASRYNRLGSAVGDPNFNLKANGDAHARLLNGRPLYQDAIPK